MLEFIVHEIKGRCPVYRGGDKITIDSPEIIEIRLEYCLFDNEADD